MAKIYLESSDSRYVIMNSEVAVIGASGSQILVINDGVTGVDVSNTIEVLEFSGSFVDYQLRHVPSSTRVEVLDSSGSVVADLSVAGQSLNFSDGARQLSSTFNPSSGTVEVLVDGVSLSPGSGTDASSSVVSLAMAQSHIVGTVDGVPTTQTAHVRALFLSDFFAWSEEMVTYGYPTSIPAEYAGEGLNTSDGWRALTPQEQQIFDALVANQNEFINLDLQKSQNGNNSDILVAAVNQSQNAEGFAYLPKVGDVFLNANGSLNNDDYYSLGGLGIRTMIHEFGHAMGLWHPFAQEPFLGTELENSYYTVMSYTDYGYSRLVHNADNSWFTYEAAHRAELGILDVAALQSIYGADMHTHSQDDVYVYDEYQRKFVGGEGYFKTIWDAGGVDTLDCSDAVYTCEISLLDYTLSSVSRRTAEEEVLGLTASSRISSNNFDILVESLESLGSQAFLNEKNLGIAFGTVIENVLTGQGNDIVTDNEVDNNINTGDGDDLIILGNGGFDTINGGSGIDTVRLSISSSDVQTFENDTGFYIVASNFGAQLIGVETIEYSDINYTV